MQEHLARAPDWGWYVVLYFFLGGLAGGAYVLGAMLRLVRDERDQPVARTAFVLSFAAMIVCPILLTLDLGRPELFWHMLIDKAGPSVNFKAISPMSVGAWILVAFGLFSTLAFADALAGRRLLRDGAFSRVFHVVGAVLGLLLAGYTGVLLSVSSQPLWSDTWTLGGLFLASAMSVSAAALALVARRRAQPSTEHKLYRADGWFIVLELVLLVLFFVTLGKVAPHYVAGWWLVAWLLVLAGILVPLAQRLRPAKLHGGVAASVLVLVAGLVLRIAIVFSPQV